jgi:hypothetical protein
MRQIREILRLKHERRLSHRAIAGACGVGVGTVSEYVRRAGRAGLSWPLPPELDEAALEARMFAAPAPGRERVAPDLVQIHQELKRAGVTLHLLWEEYREVHGDGYGYSQFCDLYRRWAGKLKPSMRQPHRALGGHFKTGHLWTGQNRPFPAAETSDGLPRGLLLAQVGVSLGAPAARTALEDVSVMEEAVE